MRLSRVVRAGQAAWPRAKSFLKNNQFVSNAIIYGGFYTAAEVVQQAVRCGDRGATAAQLRSQSAPASSASAASTAAARMDMESVKRFAIMGTVCISPMLTKWYKWIDARFPCNSTAVVTKKVFLDQFVFTPFVVIVFYVGMSALEGKKGAMLFDELKEKGLKTFAMDCCFWIPNTAFNFLCLPAYLRVSFVALSSFVWINILCWIKSWPSVTSSSPAGQQERTVAAGAGAGLSDCS